MHDAVKVIKSEARQEGTYLIVLVPGKNYTDYLYEKQIKTAEIRLDDGRCITAAQRKKAYATIADIAAYTGNVPEYEKEFLKWRHMTLTGCDYFSFSDCSVDTAREFINTIIDFSLEQGIPLSELGIDRTDDIDKYLYYCIKRKKCCVCGRDGEIHHVDTIGMGHNRKKVDDSKHRKMCLCRKHHTIAHQIGIEDFTKMYKTYGIVVKH